MLTHHISETFYKAPPIPPHATIAIISPGDMGAAVGKLLMAHNYRVVTNVSDRSTSTHTRAQATGISLLSSDIELLAQSDYILSIVPPRDAVKTAERFVNAWKELRADEGGWEMLREEGGREKEEGRKKEGEKEEGGREMVGKEGRERELWYVDLNAVSPGTARGIAGMFEGTGVKFVDGGIIGPPPKLYHPHHDNNWAKPSLVLSGPHKLPSEQLSDVLHAIYVGEEIGKASGLKCCFAATSKGLIAIGVQSYTTAKRMGVLDELREMLRTRARMSWVGLEKGVGGCPPKAYRWIDEMKEIARTMREEGGWEGGGRDRGGGGGGDLFECVSEIYGVVEEVLGGNATAGTVEDVVGLLEAGVGRQGRGPGEL